MTRRGGGASGRTAAGDGVDSASAAGAAALGDSAAPAAWDAAAAMMAPGIAGTALPRRLLPQLPEPKVWPRQPDRDCRQASFGRRSGRGRGRRGHGRLHYRQGQPGAGRQWPASATEELQPRRCGWSWRPGVLRQSGVPGGGWEQPFLARASARPELECSRRVRWARWALQPVQAWRRGSAGGQGGRGAGPGNNRHGGGGWRGSGPWRCGVASCCFLSRICLAISPGLWAWDQSIFGLVSASCRAALLLPPRALRMCVRTRSASSVSIELEWVFFSVTPTAVRASRISLLLTSNSRANSLMRTVLIRPRVVKKNSHRSLALHTDNS